MKKERGMQQSEVLAAVTTSYDSFADRYAAMADTSFFNEYYERPAMFTLLGAVKGKSVLDVGCGTGRYAEWFVAHEAQVVAIDISAQMVAITQAKLGDVAVVQQADVSQPLDFLPAQSFDLVVCPLVLDYIEDWQVTFGEFRRLLRPGGRVVFSVHHPCFLDLKAGYQGGEDYFAVEVVQEDWSIFGLTIPSYRRPLSAMAATLWQAGFVIEQLVEPTPTAECQQRYPQQYARLLRHPVFLCWCVRKG
jgi:SAM-dependent methyltransferase